MPPARSDVDAVTVDVAAFDDHVPKVDADPEGNILVVRYFSIAVEHAAGYSRLMGADEEGTLTRLKAHRRRGSRLDDGSNPLLRQPTLLRAIKFHDDTPRFERRGRGCRV
jgi:hypothetical protein